MQSLFLCFLFSFFCLQAIVDFWYEQLPSVNQKSECMPFCTEVCTTRYGTPASYGEGHFWWLLNSSAGYGVCCVVVVNDILFSCLPSICFRGCPLLAQLQAVSNTKLLLSKCHKRWAAANLGSVRLIAMSHSSLQAVLASTFESWVHENKLLHASLDSFSHVTSRKMEGHAALQS